MNGFTIVPSTTAEAKPSAAARPAAPVRLAAPTTQVFSEGKFKPAGGDDGQAHVFKEGSGASSRLIPNAMLEKFGAEWTKKDAEKPAEAADAQKPAVEPAKDQAKEAAPAAEPAKEASKGAEPAKTEPVSAPADDYKATFGDRKAADVRSELDRYAEANRKLVSDLEEARRAPRPSAKGKLDDAADGYIDDPVSAIRHLIARGLGHDDPEHADVTTELAALTSDLTSKQFGVPLDPSQQAIRDAAKARQALARDKRSRKAESDATNAPAQSEAAAAKKAHEFIGNRLVATRTGSDGKALSPLKEQFPLAAAMSQRPGARPLEEQIFDVYRRELSTGRFDPQRLSDDDYLISEAGKILEADYQDLADTLGKARTPSTAPQSKPPATAPAAADSERQGQPHGHGGRTALTAADSSTAPAKLPTAPSAAQPKKPRTKDEFFDKWYPPR